MLRETDAGWKARGGKICDTVQLTGNLGSDDRGAAGNPTTAMGQQSCIPN